VAITERYVNTTGGGAADGTSDANAWTLTQAFANAVAGHRVNVKAGTYTRTASDALTGLGTTASPIIYRGYSSTIGDLEPYSRNAGGCGSLITTNYPVIAYNATFGMTPATNTIFQDCVITGNISGAVVTMGTLGAMATCSVTNASTNAAAVAIAGNTGMICWNCDVALTGASGGSAAINNGGAAGRVIDCFVTGGPNHGILIAGANAVIIGNFVYNCAGDGIKDTNNGTKTYYGNTVQNCTSNGIEPSATSANCQMFVNNHITDCGAWGINSSGGTSNLFLAHNRTRDNTSGAVTGGGDWAGGTTYSHVTTDNGSSTSDYMSPSTQDYRLAGAAVGELRGPFKRNIGAGSRQSAVVGMVQ
jgi:hypothetical protein